MRTNQRSSSVPNLTLSYATMNRYKWVAARSGAQLNKCPHFLLEFPRSCFSWQDPPGSSRRKVAARENIRIFLDKLFLNLGISFCFSSLVSSFQRPTACDCEFTRTISDQIARHEFYVNVCKARLTKKYSHPIVSWKRNNVAEFASKTTVCLSFRTDTAPKIAEPQKCIDICANYLLEYIKDLLSQLDAECKFKNSTWISSTGQIKHF